MKEKGFTLIELLAVIVILAIIAIIATPVVLNIINETKKSARLRGSEFYLDAVEQSIAKQIIGDPTFKPINCQIENDGSLLCDGKKIKVEVKGEVPNKGILYFEKGKITDLTLMFGDDIIGKEEEKLVYLQSGLYDKEGKLIVTWEELVNDYGMDIQKDYSSVDLDSPGKILFSNEKLKHGTKLIIDSSVKIIGRAAFIHNENLREIIIPNSVTSIGESAFVRCPNLTSIIIGDNVMTIGDYAFVGSTNLKEVIISNGVTSIGNYAFRECESLTNIKIPNNVVNIGEYAFYLCTGLKEIIIPDSVTSIGDYAFISCTSLSTINYKGTEQQWNAISKTTNWDYNTPADKIINYNYQN